MAGLVLDLHESNTTILAPTMDDSVVLAGGGGALVVVAAIRLVCREISDFPKFQVVWIGRTVVDARVAVEVDARLRLDVAGGGGLTVLLSSSLLGVSSPGVAFSSSRFDT